MLSKFSPVITGLTEFTYKPLRSRPNPQLISWLQAHTHSKFQTEVGPKWILHSTRSMQTLRAQVICIGLISSSSVGSGCSTAVGLLKLLRLQDQIPLGVGLFSSLLFPINSVSLIRVLTEMIFLYNKYPQPCRLKLNKLNTLRKLKFF